MTNENIHRVEEFFEKQLDRTNTWLNFAEAKNAALIAVNIAVIAVVANLFDKVRILTVIMVAVAMVSSLICLYSFLPNLINKPDNKGRSSSTNPNLIYFEDVDAIATADDSVETYIKQVAEKYFPDKSLDKIKSNNFIYDLASEIIINSQITVRKYKLFKWALKVDLLAFILTVIVFIAA